MRRGRERQKREKSGRRKKNRAREKRDRKRTVLENSEERGRTTALSLLVLITFPAVCSGVTKDTLASVGQTDTHSIQPTFSALAPTEYKTQSRSSHTHPHWEYRLHTHTHCPVLSLTQSLHTACCSAHTAYHPHWSGIASCQWSSPACIKKIAEISKQPFLRGKLNWERTGFWDKRQK